MKINIIGFDNGVGLSRDADLLFRLFTSNGHDCQKWNFNEDVRQADLNIHLEVLQSTRNFHHAPKNVLVPNLEWFFEKWTPHLEQLTAIWCKTPDAYNWFKTKYKRTVLTLFESEDMRRNDVGKNPKKFIHVAGKSSMKGTTKVIASWMRSGAHQKGFRLSIIGGGEKVPAGYGMQFVERIESNDELKLHLNAATFHLCPSEAEGWGHYIHEAKSTGAVIITTDAPPMNMIVGSHALLLPYTTKAPHHCGMRYIVSAFHIQEAIARCTQMQALEIEERSKGARAHFEASTHFFRETLARELAQLGE
jgi:glycosyltransferase involved in cell wall biosynthesis